MYKVKLEVTQSNRIALFDAHLSEFIIHTAVFDVFKEVSSRSGVVEVRGVEDLLQLTAGNDIVFAVVLRKDLSVVFVDIIDSEIEIL